MRGEGVTQRVRMNGFRDARSVRGFPASQEDSLGRNGPAGIRAGEQPIGGPLVAPVGTQKLQEFGGKKSLPLLTSFPMTNSQHVAGAVDVTYLKLCEFRYSETATV